MADSGHTGPTIEDNVGDVLWLLLATLVVLGMTKVLLLSPPPASKIPADLSQQVRVANAVAALETQSKQLPPGGATIHPNVHVKALTVGLASRLVIFIDGRKTMAAYWKRAVELIQAQLLGCPSIERVEVIILGMPLGNTPKPLQRNASNQTLDPIDIRQWCSQLEQLTASAIEFDPVAAVNKELTGISLDARSQVLMLLCDIGPPGNQQPLALRAPVQIALFGRPTADSIGSWALRTANNGGSVTFFPSVME